MSFLKRRATRVRSVISTGYMCQMGFQFALTTVSTECQAILNGTLYFEVYILTKIRSNKETHALILHLK